jgi:hypothetical protein
MLRLPAKNIVACFADKRNISTQPRNSHSLISPLSAGIHKKSTSKHRLTCTGKVGGLYYHVSIATAYY